MAYPYIPPPSLVDRAWDLLAEIARCEHALVTLTIERGKHSRMTMTVDGTKDERTLTLDYAHV